MTSKKLAEHQGETSSELTHLQSGFENISRCIPEEPYIGLSPYSEADVFFFFGRKDKIEEISQRNLNNQRLTILYGESGVGKSSLLRAGVVNAILQQAEENKIYKIPKEVAVVFPPLDKKHLCKKDLWGFNLRKHLLNQIKEKIQELHPSIELSDFDKSKKENTNIHSNPQSLPSEVQKSWFVSTLEDWTEKLGDTRDSGYIYIILDQFEDYFLYHNQDNHENEFIEEIASTIKVSDLCVNFLISIRSDKYYKLERLKKYIPNIYEHVIKLDHLDKNSAKEAIMQPIKRYNCRQIIIDNIRDSQFTILSGQETVGKSLLLRKGVFHYLDEMAKYSLVNSQQLLSPIVFFDSWSQDPLSELVKKIREVLKCFLNKEASECIDRLNGLNEITVFLKELPEKQRLSKLLIIFDQFERYLSKYYREENDRFNKFNEELITSLFHCNSSLNVLISVRNEALDHLKKFIEDNKVNHEQYLKLNENTIELKYFDFKEKRSLEKEITVIEPENQEENVAENILEELTKEENCINDEISNNFEKKKFLAPFLQLVMFRLWEKAKQEGEQYPWSLNKLVKDLKIKEIIKEYVDEQVNNLTKKLSENKSEAWSLFPHIFYYFSTPSGSKRSLSVEELVKFADEEINTLKLPLIRLNNDNVKTIFESLVNARILLADGPSPERFEIYFDGLIPAIQTWRTKYLEYLCDIKIKQELPAQSLAHLRQGQTESAAISAINAYDFYKICKNHNCPTNLAQVDEALRGVLGCSYLSCIFERREIRERGFWQIAFSPKDGKMLVASNQNGELWLWTFNQGVQFKQLNAHNANYCSSENPLRGLDIAVSFSCDGSLLASGSRDKTVKIWDVGALMKWLDDKSPEPEPEPKCILQSRYEIVSVAFKPDGTVLATGTWCKGSEARVELWDVKNLEKPSLLRYLKGRNKYKKEQQNDNEENWFWSVTFNNDGTLLAAGGLDSLVHLWDTSGLPDLPTRLTSLPKGSGKGEICSVEFSPDGNWLASGYGNGTLGLWSVTRSNDKSKFRYKKFKSQNQHKGCIRSLAFSADSKQLASASEDQTVQLWDLSQTKNQDFALCNPKILKGHYYSVSSIAFNPHNSLHLVSCSWDRTIRHWDLETEPQIIEQYQENSGDVDAKSVAFLDEQTLASVYSDGFVRIRNLKSCSVIFEDNLNREISAVAFFCKSNQIKVVFGGLNSILLWELLRNETEITLQTANDFSVEHEINTITFSPIGDLLVSGSRDKMVRLWKVEPAKIESLETTSPLTNDDRVTSIASSFNLIEKRLMVASADASGTVKLWDISQPAQPTEAKSIKLEKKFGGGSEVVVALSQDGKLLAVGSDISFVNLWQLDQHSTPSSPGEDFAEHNFWVTSVALSQDKTFLALGRYDGSIQVYRLESGQDEQNIKYSMPITLQGHKERVSAIAFSPDNKKLASASFDNTVRLWTLETEELAEKLEKKLSRSLLFNQVSKKERSF